MSCRLPIHIQSPPALPDLSDPSCDRFCKREWSDWAHQEAKNVRTIYDAEQTYSPAWIRPAERPSWARMPILPRQRQTGSEPTRWTSWPGMPSRRSRSDDALQIVTDALHLVEPWAPGGILEPSAGATDQNSTPASPDAPARDKASDAGQSYADNSSADNGLNCLKGSFQGAEYSVEDGHGQNVGCS